jgi:hypothetical protein
LGAGVGMRVGAGVGMRVRVGASVRVEADDNNGEFLPPQQKKQLTSVGMAERTESWRSDKEFRH